MKYLVVSVIFFLVFINMAFSVRGLMHVSFTIGAKSLDKDLETRLENAIQNSRAKKRLNMKEYVEDGGVALERNPNKLVELRDLDSNSVNPIEKEDEKLNKMALKYLPASQKLLDRATIHFTIGLRFFYLAIPIGFWLLGPWPLLISTLVMVLIMYYADHSV